MTIRQEAPRATACSKCAKGIECCAFCDDPECRAALCYECVAADLRKVKARLHTHGG